MRITRQILVFAAVVILLATGLAAQPPKLAGQPPKDETDEQVRSHYVLGPGDVIAIRALHAEEFSDKPVRISETGNVSLPLVGRVHAAGLTVDELEAELTSRLKTYFQEPEVSVGITEFRSQPVSVIGAVTAPGVHQLQGRKTLIEILSMAGGIRPDAGHSVKITRRLEWGRIPLPNATDDPTGRFSIAAVNLKVVLDARNPEENILIRPHDVISVPRAEMVFVIGDVSKSGGFVLNERENVTVLQALSLAGGLNRTAAPHRARVLRTPAGSADRVELPVNLKSILAGKAKDETLQPDDILFVPNSAGRSVAYRSLETALGMGAQIGSGVAIYRR